MCLRPMLLLLLVGIASGCQRSDRLMASGAVTVDGRPVDGGRLIFRPVAAAGPSTGSPVENGKFSIAAEKGVSPGRYQVSLQALRRTGTMIQDRQMPHPVEEIVNIKLRSAQITIDVSAENAQQLSLEFFEAR